MSGDEQGRSVRPAIPPATSRCRPRGGRRAASPARRRRPRLRPAAPRSGRRQARRPRRGALEPRPRAEIAEADLERRDHRRRRELNSRMRVMRSRSASRRSPLSSRIRPAGSPPASTPEDEVQFDRLTVRPPATSEAANLSEQIGQRLHSLAMEGAQHQLPLLQVRRLVEQQDRVLVDQGLEDASPSPGEGPRRAVKTASPDPDRDHHERRRRQEPQREALAIPGRQRSRNGIGRDHQASDCTAAGCRGPAGSPSAPAQSKACVRAPV